MALATYDELTFTYNLTISPETNTATLTENHVIGRIRDLWHFWGWFIVPFYNHYNSTGCFRYGNKISNETVYDFLQRNEIKMSIVNFQTSTMLDRNTYSTSYEGDNVTDNDVPVSDSSISTYADDGEKIFNASFGTKKTYNLYNYTDDSSEEIFEAYNATVRTCKINGFAKNKNLFAFHLRFMKFLPLLMTNRGTQLFQKAKENMANMTRANYFYLISYPNYSGYKVEHDPIYTIYLTTTTTPTYPNLIPVLIITSIVAATIITVAAIKRRGLNT
jgi:hypothetical protein